MRFIRGSTEDLGAWLCRALAGSRDTQKEGWRLESRRADCMKDVGEGINMLYIFQRIFDEGSIMQLYGFPIRELRYLLPFIAGRNDRQWSGRKFPIDIFWKPLYGRGNQKASSDFHLRRWKMNWSSGRISALRKTRMKRRLI